MHRADDGEHLLHEHGRQAHGRLVHDDELRRAHNGAAHGQHLLLAAGERARELLGALFQAREARIDPLEVLRDRFFVLAEVRAHGEVFRHGHAREHLPALRHMRKAHGDDAAGVRLAQVVPVVDHGAALNGHKAGDGVQRGGLAGAVGPDERDDLAVVDLHADAAQRLHGAVGHLQIFNLQHRRPPPLRRDTPR